jgi:mannose-6-phosphate isomerase-like protein (cupin superfamily)
MNAGKPFLVGVLVGAFVMCIALTVASVLAIGSISPRANAQTARAAAKYTSTVVLENDRVRVKDVTFPPGVMDTGMHTHDLPHVGVILNDGALTFTEPGKATETVTFKMGSVGYREANVTHQVANPGRMPMRVIEVELK